MSEAGLSQRHISSKTNVSLVTVNRIIKAYRDEGRINDAPWGRPPSCTALKEDLLIVTAAVDDPFMSASEIRKHLNINISASTIRRRLWDAGLHCRIATEKPPLYESHRHQRLLFGQKQVCWGSDEWNEVLFSDKSSFTTCWDQQQSVWRPACARPAPGAPKVEQLTRMPLRVAGLPFYQPRNASDVLAAGAIRPREKRPAAV
ncbi:hypothetical protein ISCGN_030206 [Ixodes scapularis]